MSAEPGLGLISNYRLKRLPTPPRATATQSPFLPSLENLSGNLFKSNCGEYLQQPSYLLLRTEVLVHGLCFKVEREIFVSQRHLYV